MHATRLTRSAVVVAMTIPSFAGAEDSKQEPAGGTQSPAVTANELLEKLPGRWEGTCRTWFRPGQLADESEVSGTIETVLDGKFLRHTYKGLLRDKPRSGEEMLGFNAVTERWQSSWVDSFHMNYAIMFSQGEPTPRGFNIKGEYDVGQGRPPWGWRTEWKLIDDDHLVITAFNIAPGGREAKAVETTYRRTSPAADDDE